MNKQQSRTVSGAIDSRITAYVDKQIPAIATEPSAEKEITRALVTGAKLALRSQKDIIKTALDKIASDRYCGDRSLKFSDVFEVDAHMKKKAQEHADNEKARERLRSQLAIIKSCVMTLCELGKFDADPVLAIDEFETRIENL